MALDPKEKNTIVEKQVQKERRSFLKKAAYAAPTLIVMGQLAKPTKSKAWDWGSGGPGKGDDPSIVD